MSSDPTTPGTVTDTILRAGTSPGAQTLLRAIDVLAPLDAHMLIHGERGTGRRTCAALLHRQGPRSAQPFHALHLGACTDTQIGERLFGDHGVAGRAARARNATLYLDAIDRLPCALQERLVATLADGTAPGIRLIAATSTSIEEHVRVGRFSRALFDHLGTVRLSVPPLRERRDDIAPIAEHVLRRWSEQHGKRPHQLTAAAVAMLESQAWLGNVHELVEVLETACAQTRALTLTAEHVQLVLGRRPRHPAFSDILPLKEMECAYIRNALARCGGNRSLAAKRLGISRNTLIRRLRDCERQGSRAA